MLVVFVVAWAVNESWPPTSLDLIEVFQERASNSDTNLTAIVQRAKKLQDQTKGSPFTSLREAIGPTVITNYFPTIDVKGEKDSTRFILNRLQHDSAGKIKLGLDLQGGTSFLVGLDTNKLALMPAGTDKKQVLSQAVEVLRKRVDKFGVAEPLIQPAGEDRILIQLPGLSDDDMQRAKMSIQKAAFLEFRMVHKDSRELVEQGSIEPGYEVLSIRQKREGRSEQVSTYLVRKKPDMTGKYVKHAMATANPMSGTPEISFELNDEGAKIFSQLTSENIGRQLAIVLDGELYSAPVINGEISSRGSISGDFDWKEAYELANVLQNPLEVPVGILDERRVEPSLGKDSIESGVKSAIIGTLAVAGFMLVYYLMAGMVANVALITNLIILLGVMCSVGTTLTLPGIAGIVLTIGMAVDANVLIYERIREELAKSKSLRGAIAAGYDRAFSTIFDSHVTTLISSVILIYMGTGSVKGFGVTLTIGVAASLFTALVVTRLIFDFLLARNWIKTLPMLHMIRATKLDFMKLARPAFTISWLIIIIGIGYGLYRGKSMLGPDFIGGDSSTFSFEQKVEVEQLRTALSKTVKGDLLIQFQKEITGNKETLRVTSATGTGDIVKEALTKEFAQAKYKMLSQDRVGPTVGSEIQKTAIVAMLLSLFGILVYVAFRYEFSFAVGAVIAVLHDVLMTIGWYCLSGREFNATMVAAVLTIIGFSINDTIVIFDRIREDLKMGVRGSFKDLINQALNQTLSRTIITSGTVFLATMSLYLFGGGVINDFAYTFLVGIITGTYSSIYIASALVLWWHKGERPKGTVGGSQVVLNPGSGDEPMPPARAVPV